MPATRADVEKAVASVHPDAGYIVVEWLGWDKELRKLAYRAPVSAQVSDKRSAVMIVLGFPPRPNPLLPISLSEGLPGPVEATSDPDREATEGAGREGR
jgi:hypothetical protein